MGLCLSGLLAFPFAHRGEEGRVPHPAASIPDGTLGAAFVT